MRINKMRTISLSLILMLVTGLCFAGTVSKVGQQVDDAAITTKVLFKITKNPLLSPFKIRVSTNKGIVNLTGLVNTDLQYEKAVELAQETNGVLSVTAVNLKVKESKRPLTDAYFSGRIKGLLLLNDLMSYAPNKKTTLNVEVKNKIVYVNGMVKNKQQKAKVLQIIKSVDGIAGVKSNIKVK